MIRVFRAMLLAGVLALLAGQTARADVFFEFSDGSTFGTNFDIGLNQTIDLEVYLSESSTPLPNNPITTGGGLVQGGVEVTFTNGTGSGTLNSATANSVANSGQFDFGSQSVVGNVGTVKDLQVVSAPVSVDGDGRVLLGTFSFTGTSLGTISVSANDPTAGPDNVTDMDYDPSLGGSQTNLDAILSSGSVTISVVPEPSSMILCGLAAVGIAGGACRRFRLRKKAG